MHIREKFINEIANRFQALSNEKIGPLVSENLLSPFHIELPGAVLKQAQFFVDAAFALRERDEYRSYLSSEARNLGILDPGNKSICMSYDFHLAQEGTLKLIEINTNASFLALADLLYSAAGIARPVSDFSLNEIKENILEELLLNGKTIRIPNVATVDENPPEQRLYIEFLVFSELFKSWGWSSKILDYRDPIENVDFIYNRFTDFYFSEDSSRSLKERFN